MDSKTHNINNKETGESIFHPLVSIVIPVYNGANFLAEAIDSALAQTYDNIEIVVVNDGSRDEGATEKVALSYGERIRYYAKSNGGVSSALNYGIEQMKGDYFSWLSHDDLYEPEKIEREIQVLSRCKDKVNTIVCCADRLIDAEGKPIYHPSVKLDGLYSGEEMFNMLLTTHLLINGCTLLIHKHLFDMIGTFSSFRIIQDIELWMKFMLNGVSFYFITDVLNIMRVHTGQVSNNCQSQYITERNAFNKDLIDHYVKLGKMTDANVDAFLYFLYKNHFKESYSEIERYTGKVNYAKKYALITYGYLYDLIRFAYRQMLKK